jgi:general secretion pathway protein L
VSAPASYIRRLPLWIDDVAAGLTRLGAKLRRGGRVELIEQADGAFLAAEWRKGAAHPLDEPPLRLDQDRFADPMSARIRTLLARSRVDVMLAPSRFVIRTLELPRGASQFLEGIVRSQIDRLTPWSASDAVFGCSSPADAGPDRIAIAVAATASALVAPIARALVAARVDHIRMSTTAGDGGTLAIPVFAQRSGDEDGARRLRRGLTIGLGLSGLAFAMSCGAWAVIGGADETHFAELQTRIAERRAALMNQQGLGGRTGRSGQEAGSAFRHHDSRGACEDATGRHAFDGAPYRRRQGSNRRPLRRRACADPAYGAVATFCAGYIFRAYGQSS